MPAPRAKLDIYGIPEGGNNSRATMTIRYFGGSAANYQLTWSELIAAIAEGGWPQAKWAEAAAVAAAESDRKFLIYNTYKLGHFGLFQISRSAHSAFFTGVDWVVPWSNAAEGYRIYKSEGWKAWEAHGNPAYLANLAQARAAVAAFKAAANGRTGQAYWRTLYRTRTLELIWNAAVAGNGQAASDMVGSAVAGGVGAGAGATADGVLASGDAVASTVGSMAQVVTGMWESLTTPAFWMRVAYGVTGVVLVAGGLFLMVRTSPAVAGATKTAQRIATKGVVS